MADDERTLGEVWAKYEAMCVPASANAEQRLATRNAFYTGAHTIWSLLMNGVSKGGEIAPSDMALMESMQGELDSFVAQVVARGAAAYSRKG